LFVVALSLVHFCVSGAFLFPPLEIEKCTSVPLSVFPPSKVIKFFIIFIE